MTYVTGNTYPHRYALRRRGLRWDPEARAWYGTAAQAEGMDYGGMHVQTATTRATLVAAADEQRLCRTPDYLPSTRRLMRRLGWEG